MPAKLRRAYDLKEENNNTERYHGKPSIEPHAACVGFSPLLHLPQKSVIAPQQKKNRQWENKEQVVENEIAQALAKGSAVMKESQHHKVRPSRTGKFTEPHEETEDERRGDRSAVHERSQTLMGNRGNLQMNVKSGK